MAKKQTPKPTKQEPETPDDALTTEGKRLLSEWLAGDHRRARQAPPGSWQRVKAYLHARGLCHGTCPWVDEHADPAPVPVAA